MKAPFDIEVIEIGDRYFSAQGEAEYVTEDIGIGPYEYWGFKEVDVRIVTYLEDIVNIMLYELDEDGNATQVTDEELIEKVRAQIWGDVEKICQEQADSSDDFDERYAGD